eukprot:6186667-Pleurochrysis_carterae.AAC.3
MGARGGGGRWSGGLGEDGGVSSFSGRAAEFPARPRAVGRGIFVPSFFEASEAFCSFTFVAAAATFFAFSIDALHSARHATTGACCGAVQAASRSPTSATR